MLPLTNKIKAALAAALAVDGAAFLSAWGGSTTWHEALGVVIGSAFTLAIGYLTPEGSKAPAPPK